MHVIISDSISQAKNCTDVPKMSTCVFLGSNNTQKRATTIQYLNHNSKNEMMKKTNNGRNNKDNGRTNKENRRKPWQTEETTENGRNTPQKNKNTDDNQRFLHIWVLYRRLEM